ncbi:MAG: hypothetical protein D6808_08385 [Candidatus Dadabacteria bacterium]|nr:MAG: hypothetical protein D6808_08385 [Candidatus Dadabacteria bacterium]
MKGDNIAKNLHFERTGRRSLRGDILLPEGSPRREPVRMLKGKTAITKEAVVVPKKGSLDKQQEEELEMIMKEVVSLKGKCIGERLKEPQKLCEKIEKFLNSVKKEGNSVELSPQELFVIKEACRSISLYYSQHKKGIKPWPLHSAFCRQIKMFDVLRK